jgi:hypothetical protein
MSTRLFTATVANFVVTNGLNLIGTSLSTASTTVTGPRTGRNRVFCTARTARNNGEQGQVDSDLKLDVDVSYLVSSSARECANACHRVPEAQIAELVSEGHARSLQTN